MDDNKWFQVSIDVKRCPQDPLVQVCIANMHLEVKFEYKINGSYKRRLLNDVITFVLSVKTGEKFGPIEL